MKKIHMMVLLIVVLLFMMGFLGNTANASHASHATGFDYSTLETLSVQLGAQGGNFGLDNVYLDNCLIALYASQDGMAGGFSYVPRARDLIDQNANRNTIMDYIIANPGSTQNDMVRALDMNIGTLRYHLMILSLNHRVIAYNDGPRLVRYFVNKGTYSQDQMMVLSLLKREPTSKLLSALAWKTSATGSQISAGSGMSYSDVNRYMKELTAKGVVVKESTDGDRYRYCIAPEYEEYVCKNLRLQ